jgi:hypothetical protein
MSAARPAVNPQPLVCAHEPIIRLGLEAAGRLTRVAPLKFQYAASGVSDGADPCVHGRGAAIHCPECDRRALARALELVALQSTRFTMSCVSDQVIEHRATIQGLSQMNTDLIHALRASEEAKERALDLLSEKAKSPFAASGETVGAADLPRGDNGRL